MESENASRKIKTYCFEHQATCEVVAKPRIVCTIEDHTLSVGFPNAEFWQFCCDCETFFPTKSEVTGKIIINCPSCDRLASRRFICQVCSIAPFESDEPARGKTYRISQTVGIEPRCPGCETMTQRGKLVSHRCGHLEAEFFTAREKCPFCLESTEVGFVIPGKHAYSPTPPGSRSEAIGLACPACSTPLPPNSDFCGECGMVVRSLIPPPPPPPPPNRTGRLADSFTAALDGGTEKLRNESTFVTGKLGNPDAITSVLKEPVLKVIALAVGGIILFAVLVAAISSRTSGTASFNNQGRNTIANATNAAANAARVAANTLASVTNAAANSINTNSNIRPSNAGSLIGRTGTLGWDTALREFPHKDSIRLGVHYRGASFEVLDVAENIPNDEGGTSRWYQVKVVRYGRSVDANNEGVGKDHGSADIGWVNGITYVWKGPNRDRKVRARIILLD